MSKGRADADLVMTRLFLTVIALPMIECATLWFIVKAENGKLSFSADLQKMDRSSPGQFGYLEGQSFLHLAKKRGAASLIQPPSK